MVSQYSKQVDALDAGAKTECLKCGGTDEDELVIFVPRQFVMGYKEKNGLISALNSVLFPDRYDCLLTGKNL